MGPAVMSSRLKNTMHGTRSKHGPHCTKSRPQGYHVTHLKLESAILILIKHIERLFSQDKWIIKMTNCATCRSIVCKKYNRIALWRPQGCFIDFLSTSFHVTDSIPKEIIASDKKQYEMMEREVLIQYHFRTKLIHHQPQKYEISFFFPS